MNNKLMRIYLNDHLAGATAGLELAKRTAKSNSDSEFGAPLSALCDEIEGDKNALSKIMDDLGVPQDALKQQAASLGEKLGRLKLNGQITGYSPLSRVVELEGLKLGVTGKLSLWRTLEHLGDAVPLETTSLKDLIRRAESQLEQLEELRLKAATIAMSSTEETNSR